MNINGDKVIWQNGNIAITDTRRGYVVYKQYTSNNKNGTAFRRWSEESLPFDTEEESIEFAKKL